MIFLLYRLEKCLGKIRGEIKKIQSKDLILKCLDKKKAEDYMIIASGGAINKKYKSNY